MPDLEDVRRIVAGLPGTSAHLDSEQPRFSVLPPSTSAKGKAKGIAWTWLERVDPHRPRRPNPRVLAVRVSGELEKHELIAAEPDVYFTEPHYNGYPAVLVRLDAIDVAELTEILTEAWHRVAPARLVAAYDAGEVVG
jgi:hypothetical protein